MLEHKMKGMMDKFAVNKSQSKSADKINEL